MKMLKTLASRRVVNVTALVSAGLPRERMDMLRIDYNGYDRAGGARLQVGSRVYSLAVWRVARGFDMHSLEPSVAVDSSGRPVMGSELIDGGIDLGLPFCGLAPDIGAYEVGCEQ